MAAEIDRAHARRRLAQDRRRVWECRDPLDLLDRRVCQDRTDRLSRLHLEPIRRFSREVVRPALDPCARRCRPSQSDLRARARAVHFVRRFRAMDGPAARLALLQTAWTIETEDLLPRRVMSETAAVIARVPILVAMSRDAMNRGVMSRDAMNVGASLSVRVTIVLVWTTVLAWTIAIAIACLATLRLPLVDVTSAAAARRHEVAARPRVSAAMNVSATMSASRSGMRLEEAGLSIAVPSARDSDRPCAGAARLVETAERTSEPTEQHLPVWRTRETSRVARWSRPLPLLPSLPPLRIDVHRTLLASPSVSVRMSVASARSRTSRMELTVRATPTNRARSIKHAICLRRCNPSDLVMTTAATIVAMCRSDLTNRAPWLDAKSRDVRSLDETSPDETNSDATSVHASPSALVSLSALVNPNAPVSLSAPATIVRASTIATEPMSVHATLAPCIASTSWRTSRTRSDCGTRSSRVTCAATRGTLTASVSGDCRRRRDARLIVIAKWIVRETPAMIASRAPAVRRRLAVPVRMIDRVRWWCARPSAAATTMTMSTCSRRCATTRTMSAAGRGSTIVARRTFQPIAMIGAAHPARSWWPTSPVLASSRRRCCTSMRPCPITTRSVVARPAVLARANPRSSRCAAMCRAGMRRLTARRRAAPVAAVASSM